MLHCIPRLRKKHEQTCQGKAMQTRDQYLAATTVGGIEIPVQAKNRQEPITGARWCEKRARCAVG